MPKIIFNLGSKNFIKSKSTTMPKMVLIYFNFIIWENGTRLGLPGQKLPLTPLSGSVAVQSLNSRQPD